MVYDWNFTSVKMLPYFENFPRNFTCWHLERRPSKATIVETMHKVLVVDRALPGNAVAWTMFEWDAFRYKAIKRAVARERKHLGLAAVE